MWMNRIIPWLVKVISVEVRTMKIIWVIPLLNSSELQNVYYVKTGALRREIISVE
jgi:hypothetical protein